ncbi:MAG: family ATPase [Thermoleophilia bacterium]|nr:family ATPase [Thermoleophilia bacterium]
MTNLAPTSRRWTEPQARSIEARGRTLVTAAAGSGKTSVLTELVASRLLSGELAPSEVCAVTFTEKAAQEMRGRIAAKLAEAGRYDLLSELELARIGTIHGLCSWILRNHGTAVGVAPGALILDEAQSAFVRREALEAVFEAAIARDDVDVHWLRARMGDARIATTLEAIFDIAATSVEPIRLVDCDEVQAPVKVSKTKTPKPDVLLVAPADCRRALSALTQLWSAYEHEVERRKHGLGRLSFDDLERLAVAAVRRDEVATALRAKWSIVLVDEFQDTNERQYELLDTIGGDHLFMVGDEWQSIYRFRGADIDVFRARKLEMAARGGGIEMLDNFRSTGPVLDVVNRMFADPEIFDGYVDVTPGTAAQRAAEGPSVELLVVPTNVEGSEAEDVDGASVFEARRVAERIGELVEAGAATPGDIAVLMRTRTHAAVYEEEIRAWGIPVLRSASDGFYDQRDVRDVLTLLALVRNRRDEGAALAALAGPVGSLGWTELDSVARHAREHGLTLLEAAAASDLPGARRVVTVLDDLAEVAGRESLVRVVARAVELPELELGAASQIDGAVRLANLRRLVELAESAAEIDVADVAGLLEFVDAQRRSAKVGEASIADESLGAVRLMTVHASKGLEFKYVFVVESASRTTPPADAVPAPLVDEHGVVHVALPGDDGRARRTPPHEELHERDKLADDAELRRLWYVAMTRAEHHLVISGRWDFSPTKANKPRSVSGSLAWLAPALGVEEPYFGGEERVSTVLDGMVVLDTRRRRREPVAVWHPPTVDAVLAEPLPLPPVEEAPAVDPSDSPDPHQLRERLRAHVVEGGSQEWRQLDGTRLHDAVARLLDAARSGVALERLLDPEHGPWLTDRVRERLTPVVASAVFRRLVTLGARAEVPYVAGGRDDIVTSRVAPGVSIARELAQVDAGRFDALARTADGSWWVVDWKTTLPADRDEAWAEHGRQLERYARTLLATGASSVELTLVSLADPSIAHTWERGVPSAPQSSTDEPTPEIGASDAGNDLMPSLF